MRRVVTKELCLEIASKYFNRNELQKADCYIYKVMYKNGWIDEAFPVRFKKKQTVWSEESLRAIAAKYESRNAFKWGDWNAYHAARRQPYFESICSHMKPITVSDRDVVYLLKTSLTYNDLPVYKIGISSERVKKRRLAELKYGSGLHFDVVHWVLTPNAEELEKTLLCLGQRPMVKNFRGYSELRAFTPSELEVVESLLVQAGGV